MKPKLEPTDPLVPPAGHPRFPQFDSLRALAAISILVIHAALFSQGFGPSWHGRIVAHLDIGVPFFFLLSAFLLYRPFLAARELGAPATPLANYAKRRFVRVLPAYWLALTVAAIVPGMAGAFSSNWWVYYGLLQNYPVFTPEGGCATDPYRCGLPPTWTLALEVAFYALLPLFVLAMAWVRRRWRGRSWLGPELAAVLALSAVSVAIQSLPPSTDLRRWLFFSPLGRGWWFGTGLALAALSVWVQEREQTPRWVSWIRDHGLVLAGAGAGLYVIACLFVLEPYPTLAGPAFISQIKYVSQYLLFGLIAALVALPAAFGARGVLGRALSHPLLGWLGLISYGIFLWQFPVIILLVDSTGIEELSPRSAFPLLTLATLAGTIVCAAISFYALERPLMRYVRRRTRDSAEPGGAQPLERPLGAETSASG